MTSARSPLGRIRSWALPAALLMLAVACAGAGAREKKPDPTPDPEPARVSCASFVAALARCEVITGTRLKGCTDDAAKLECVIGCVEAASCEEVTAVYCGRLLNGYADCVNACSMAAAPKFTCGDGSTVDARWRCDGADDCPDGADEECPDGSFTCNDGVGIPEAWHCDRIEDCLGGEDERDCGAAFQCGDGTSVGSSSECDGRDDCPGGEDERGCTQLTCE